MTEVVLAKQNLGCALLVNPVLLLFLFVCLLFDFVVVLFALFSYFVQAIAVGVRTTPFEVPRC